MLQQLANAVHLQRMAVIKREALEMLGSVDMQVGDRAGLEVTGFRGHQLGERAVARLERQHRHVDGIIIFKTPPGGGDRAAF